MLNVLVACEFSGIVRDAFLDAGCHAVSCDLLPSESGKGEHIQGRMEDVDVTPFDLVIAHPPCTYLCRSGLQWVSKRDKYVEQQQSLDFVRYLMHLPVRSLCVENPIGIISTRVAKPSQIIQPYMFGVGETKATCLWLKGLPLLQPTCPVRGRKPVVHYQPPAKDRWKKRSRTYPCIAAAMAEQWSAFLR